MIDRFTVCKQPKSARLSHHISKPNVINGVEREIIVITQRMSLRRNDSLLNDVVNSGRFQKSCQSAFKRSWDTAAFRPAVRPCPSSMVTVKTISSGFICNQESRIIEFDIASSDHIIIQTDYSNIVRFDTRYRVTKSIIFARSWFHLYRAYDARMGVLSFPCLVDSI